MACYCRDTLIGTDMADVPVEELSTRHRVRTVSGEARSVRWIGRRSYAGPFLAASPRVQPIRFCAGSLGYGLPRRDLLVSPDHAMFLDGLLIPAHCLVNGTTIVQVRGLERVDCFHAKLDSHDVLLAEGAPSESFMDDDSRGLFHNAAEFDVLSPSVRPPEGFCRPRVESGFALEADRRKLARLAPDLAHSA